MPLDVITRIVPRSASIVRTFVSPGGLTHVLPLSRYGTFHVVSLE